METYTVTGTLNKAQFARLQPAVAAVWQSGATGMQMWFDEYQIKVACEGAAVEILRDGISVESYPTVSEFERHYADIGNTHHFEFD